SGFQTRNALAEELRVPLTRVNQVVDFLLSRGLCEERAGKIHYAKMNTYVSQTSPLVNRHHSNWRMKVHAQLDQLTLTELAYTNPIVVNDEDFAKIREELIQFIERFKKIAEPSPSERLCCLNIDWVHVRN